MAVQIIGQTRAEETRKDTLPFPEVDLPHPQSAAAAKPVIGQDRLRELLEHPHSLVRIYVVQRLGTIEGDPSVLDPLIPLIDDPAPEVARAAMDVLGDRRHAPAADALASRFRTGDGLIAASAAIALERCGPDRLVDEVRVRSRLDDYAYTFTTMSLARSESDAARVWLEKAMDRAGALHPNRRVALYSAVLLAGFDALATRAIRLAISDSRSEKTSDKTTPGRVAVASIAGLPGTMAVQAVGQSILQQLPREDHMFEGDERRAFDAAVRGEKIAEAIRALAPLLDRAPTDGIDPDLANSARRARVLLRALVADADPIGALPAQASAIFAAAALQRALVIDRASHGAAENRTVEAIAKNLQIPVETLIAATADELAERLGGKSPREIRPIVAMMGSESLDDERLVERLVQALLRGGHGTAVLDAAAEAKRELLPVVLIRVFASRPAEAEEIVQEALERRPIEPRVATLALRIAGRLGTERLALVIGRRFLDLRATDREGVTNAVVRIGDTRLAPLIAARAFPNEPEELAWVLLSLLAGAPVEGKLAEAIARVEGAAADESSTAEERIALPLSCTRCGEALTYNFRRVYVDPKSKDPNGDPAFVGDTICKACGAEDTLVPTPDAAQVMTEAMMGFLLEAEESGGMPHAEPLVVPRRFVLGGREMGPAEALRHAEKGVAASPHSIRAHLERGRVRLLLKRRGAMDDALAVLEQDSISPEGLLLRAGAHLQRGDRDAAIADLVQALHAVRSPIEPRIYERPLGDLEVEASISLAHLERAGAAIPPDVDLANARAALDARDQKIMDRVREREADDVEEQAEEDEETAAGEAPSGLSPEILRRTGRNDPCPCGSGKKFKKCHGA